MLFYHYGENGFKPTEAIKKYAEKRLSKVEVPDDNQVTITYGRNGNKGDFYVSYSYKDFHFTKEDPDMYRAIDLLSDVVKNKLREKRYKH